jgi:hypothetical protein
VIKRVFEAVYAKVLVSEEELLRPDPKNLSPKAKALFDLLFPPRKDRRTAATGGPGADLPVVA